MTDAPPTIPGTNTLLLGATGTGKTYSIRTFLERGITPFIISTEPGVASTLGDLPPEKCHWHYVAPAHSDWDALLKAAKRTNDLSFESLTKVADPDKRKQSQWLDLITTCNQFVCDRDGKDYGDVATWGPDRVLVVDSLSGLNTMSMNLVTGSKPVKSPGEWQIAMDNIERFLTTLLVVTDCFFVLIGHLEVEKDELTGGTKLMASTLGRKLAPKIPLNFDDVVQAIRVGKEFHWSTGAINVDLKARNLPIGDKLAPSFVPIIDKWKEKL